MPNDDELKKRLERERREKFEEAQRRQNEELRRINEQNRRDKSRIEKSNEGGPISERPTKDED